MARWASGSCRWVSQPCWVTRTSGAKARTSGGTTRVDRAQPGGVAGAGRQRDVGDRAARRRAADVGRPAGAREEVPAALVHRDREHPRVVPEHPLDAVAVVHVDVDVGDPLGAVVEQPLDADGDVVVDAEAGRVAAHRVVQAAAVVDAVLGLALPHAAADLEGALGDAGRRLVHARRRPGRRRCRARGATSADGRGRPRRGARRRCSRGRARWRARRRRRHRGPAGSTWSSTPSARAQAGGEVEAHGGHRVGGAEVVGGEHLVPDDARPCGHVCTLLAAARVAGWDLHDTR